MHELSPTLAIAAGAQEVTGREVSHLPLPGLVGHGLVRDVPVPPDLLHREGLEQRRVRVLRPGGGGGGDARQAVGRGGSTGARGVCARQPPRCTRRGDAEGRFVGCQTPRAWPGATPGVEKTALRKAGLRSFASPALSSAPCPASPQSAATSPTTAKHACAPLALSLPPPPASAPCPASPRWAFAAWPRRPRAAAWTAPAAAWTPGPRRA